MFDWNGKEMFLDKPTFGEGNVKGISNVNNKMLSDCRITEAEPACRGNGGVKTVSLLGRAISNVMTRFTANVANVFASSLHLGTVFEKMLI